jgi:hypothetical protein
MPKLESNGLSPSDECIIDIRPDGKVSTPWLSTEGHKILLSVGKEPEEHENISNFCG